MDPDDRELFEVCCSCGAVLSSDARGFAFGTQNMLCATCATARGGQYDTERETWTVPPDLSGLADEAYGASPHERRRG